MGHSGTDIQEVLQILHKGMMSLAVCLQQEGTGEPYIQLQQQGDTWLGVASTTGHQARFRVRLVVASDDSLWLNSTVATDLSYISLLHTVLRSE